LAGKPKKLNHPIISYLLGLIVMVLTLIVLFGVLYHLTLSHHGPQLLVGLKAKYLDEQKSTFLAEARRLEDMEKHEHFHRVVDYPQIPEDKRSVCAICHSDYPHKKNKRIRSLMNMHTQYLACETCHIKPRVGAAIVYRWYSPVTDHPQGPFFGTRYDLKTDRLVTGDPFAKIAPDFKYDRMVPPSLTLAKTDDLWSPLQTQNAPMARDFMKVRDRLTPEQREGVKNQFHENIKPKGLECRKCHSEKSILDYRHLGFSEKRARDLTHLEVAGMIAKYEEFYLPELFGEAVKETSKEGK